MHLYCENLKRRTQAVDKFVQSFLIEDKQRIEQTVVAREPGSIPRLNQGGMFILVDAEDVLFASLRATQRAGSPVRFRLVEAPY